MRKILLILGTLGIMFFCGEICTHAKVKQSNRIVWSMSSKVYKQKIRANEPAKSGTDEGQEVDVSQTTLDIPRKQLNHNKIVFYRLSAHKKYLIPVEKMTWAAARRLISDRNVEIKSVAKIKRPAIYFNISYKTKHGVKNYWVWRLYTAYPAVIHVDTKDNWQNEDYFINHPNPFHV